MDTSTIIMMAAAVIVLILVYWKSPHAAGRGLNATGSLILENHAAHGRGIYSRRFN